MKQDIENIIKKNLPEKKKEFHACGRDENGISNCPAFCNNVEYNQALSKINTTLIADEVLKVVGKFLFENLQSNHDKCPNKMTCIGYQSCVSDIENLLSNLSYNKENK